MKKLIFLFTFLATVFATVSCTREDVHGSVVPVSQGELVTLRVGVSTVLTRADTDGEESDFIVEPSDEEAMVNSLQVFVFSGNGEFERSAYVKDSISVGISCFAGHKNVVAVVNAPYMIDWADIPSLDALNSKVTDLKDNRIGNFFMYGCEEADVPEDESVEITVSRRVARVILQSVCNEITSSSAVGSLYLNAVYLLNVAWDAAYSDLVEHNPSDLYNQGRFDGYDEDENVIASGFDLTASPYSFLYYGLGEQLLESGNPYKGEDTFYCYPNPTEQSTRLVVEATLNGRTWYYPVTIKDVEANHSYEVKLTITGAGASSPDSDPQIADFQFGVDVSPWQGRVLTEII